MLMPSIFGEDLFDDWMRVPVERETNRGYRTTELMKTDIVKEQLKLLHFRNVSKACGFDAELAVSSDGEFITFIWTNQGESATLRANLKTFEYEITDSEGIYA